MLESKATWKHNEMNDTIIDWIDSSINVSPIVQELLLQRGIKEGSQALRFLSPDLNDLHKPIGLLSIDKAGKRVKEAITNQEKILVYGDYDADGVSSTTVLLKALKELGANCDYYIPNRFTEGYGPNEDAFRLAYENGAKLIITVDCGIASVQEALLAKELGMDLIITDHHEVQEKIPDAYAVIHPKCSPDYGFPELAGVGVAFKFAEHLLGYFPGHLLEFVAIGTIADLVPLVSENRILTFHGLKSLTTTTNPGIKALKGHCNIEGNVTEEDVGFLIGPRINAVGRLQNADLAVQLLMTEDQEEADYIAERIDSINLERQRIVNDIVKEAELMVNSTNKKGIIIAAKEGWNEGVLGIVASKLVRKYDRPAIVLAVKPETSEVKGSARSIPAFDLFKNCMTVRELFTHFGGHAQAAGMTLPMDNLSKLQEELNRIIDNQLTEDDFKQAIEISQSISVKDINEKLINDIARLAPFGMKNPKPVFHLTHAPKDVRQIGSKKTHLKLHFKEEEVNLEGIGFGFGHLYPLFTPKTLVSIVGELGINEWNGFRKPQIVLQDLAIEEWQLFDCRGKKDADVSQYISLTNNNLIVSNNNEEYLPGIKQITYQEIGTDLPQVDTLYILDLPDLLDELKELVQITQPKNVYAGYHVENSVYLTSFPSRDDFKWLYALLLKRKQIDMKTELNKLVQMKGWSKEKLIFLSKVFFELEFVKIENGIITVVDKPVKKDLSESEIYQKRKYKAELERILYYSNYEELRNWFIQCMDYVDSPKEELAHGL
ncbi:single-stranded-DNA-specific exonuclease RecJ [Virgibacillus halodenitrificans]|uniref:single-stranded-DNA-specific exonuclease RecJ n=1 Tax=Virgibacillus halodenitrificans TaxID=1482 RepID=UPI00045C3EE6|nr:single-stranded-DNA-specific exonuclease RecJ [Virgibacillus halodenitrificans]CDQ35390.1 Single-stranded-DNA-specific exonuclease RecJ [Virgibacillus halodenitrificans]